MKKVNGHEIISLFEQWSPKRFAMEGDPVGLHIGQLNRPVDKVLVTLDVNEEVIDEAIQGKANLIIAHHPPIFRPLKNILTDTPQGRMIEKCIKHDISVYAAHTNLDVAPGGVNDMLAAKLGLTDTKIVEPTFTEALYKLAVYSPITHATQIRQALARAGAGAIGEYQGCSYTTLGTGRFTPVEGATPYIGEVGAAEEVEEERIEVVLPSIIREKVLKAMLAAHPYEEPAYDFFVLDQRTNEYGLGRIGKLKESMTLAQFAEQVKSTFNVPAVRFVGDPNKVIRKVAVLGGDGNKYITAAKRRGADVLVTGDLYYHIAHDADALGLAVIDPGHNIEKVMIEGVAEHMQKACEEAHYDVTFIESEVITEPFHFM
ncbi:Nif3-like dinuclear metal center hexameric protein [Filibacter tadaridae]|uniref:GTP cyclohydrolase 1 type 2 homolog n=1 Tax=Filibacter tadaridae TaxID=2483811 RepID=A0A3P5XLC2_9BACL|nr:Nif3-like dinuclear metal center hexameric protein [Filibacter tadaridae]VDC32453.1 Putative GTP cyclohydrolase 1 type 2 [Filibacter tadaridae]